MKLERTDRSRAPPEVGRPEFHQLATFLRVVETGRFAGAARLTGRSQPAISQAIARLEEIYGGDLFERRRGARLALTPIGVAILPSARTILYTVDQQMVRAVETARSRVGTVTLGFLPGLATGPLREGISVFLAASPAVRLQLVEGQPGELHRQLNERTIDLLVTAFLPDLGNNAIEQEQLWIERLIVALPAAHALADKSALRWEEIATTQVMLRASQGEMIAFRSLLPRFSDRIIDCEQHSVSRDVLLDMVGIGMGVTVVLESGVSPRKDVVFRPIVGENASVPIQAVWPRTDGNPLRHQLLNHLRRSHAGPPDTPLTSPFPATAPAPDRD